MRKKKVAQIYGKRGRLAGGRLDALGGQLSTTWHGSQGVGSVLYIICKGGGSVSMLSTVRVSALDALDELAPLDHLHGLADGSQVVGLTL